MLARCSFDTEPWWARARIGASSTTAVDPGAAVTPDPPIIWAGNFSGATPVSSST